MKKLVILLLVGLLLLVGCEMGTYNLNESDDVPDAEEQDSDIQEDEEVMDEYIAILGQSEDFREVVEFVDMNIKNLEIESANEMILKLEVYLRDFFDYESPYWGTFDKLNKYYVYPEGLDSNKITETDLKEFYDDLLDSGYKLEMMEGMVNPIVDYRWMAKYNDYISEDISDYFELCALESDELSMEDAGIVISWDELGKRVLATEQYLSKHLYSQAREQASLRYEEYLWMYMLGSNNTPVADYESNEMTDEVLASYNRLIEENNETMTAEKLSKYIQILSEMNFILPYNKQEKFDIFYSQLEDLIKNN